MAASFSTFERLKDKGIAAYKKGEYTTAKTYLLEAACGPYVTLQVSPSHT